jgi:selenocysteine lyase/cysteine desulfurase
MSRVEMQPLLPTHDAAWAHWRTQFPLLERKVYLNSCSYGALPRAAMAAFEHYVAERNEKGADWEDWVRQNEALRVSLAALLGAQPDEIALTTSASAGLSSLASALRFEGKRRKIIITELDFPTNAHVWYAQQLRGAEVVRLSAQDGRVPLASFADAIDDTTLLVATSHISYLNGARIDARALIELAHSRGAYALIDEFQAAGTLARTAAQLGADFAVGGTFKYLLGTAGSAYLFVRERLLADLVPTSTGWFAQQDVMAMDVSGYRPHTSARRFEAGTPAVVNTYAAAAGVAVLRQVGLDSIAARVAELTRHIKSEAARAGYAIATPEDPAAHGALIALRSTDERKLVADLLAEGIVTSSRGGNLRVAPHAYNNTADIDALFRALSTRRALLRMR